MNTYRVCPSCGRQVVAALFNRASAHAPGCSFRRSILTKENYQAKQRRRERARKAAETRRRRRNPDPTGSANP